MGTIVERPRKKGGTAYMAKIIIKREGVTVLRETQTFDRRPAAAAWISRREDELSKPGAIERAKISANDPLLSAVIDQYIAESEKEIGRTKAQVLRTIKTFGIAGKRCSEIDTAAITDFAKQLDCAPQTRGNYLSHLAAIFAVAKPMWRYPLDRAAIEEAQVVLRKLGIISKSKERDRRPTIEELDRLMAHFEERQKRRPSSAPMCRLIAFAVFSTRRQEEITRITWSDLDEEHSRVLVRDMKHPGQKDGNDTWCDLPEPAMQIIKAMPKVGPEIFPYSADAISAAFTRACALLEIDDLHFHDLRHDGVSWLFERGYTIPHAAAVSGHRSWNSLKRYTQLRQRGDKYAGWKWLAKVTARTNS
ncbi:site-specific integrase [Bradyrhizobium sp. HKCCYLS2038]|uniref:site-specific integrase n=1 Tax=Bradyrhizobium sp. HKCCYLS2038 TaxID=3420764 RepID=UPI003EC13FDC